MKESIYVSNGYKDREDYLESLAADYEIELSSVLDLSNILGDEEDFDGLISSLEDWSYLL